MFANRANETQRSGFIATPYDTIFHQSMDAAGGNAAGELESYAAGRSSQTTCSRLISIPTGEPTWECRKSSGHSDLDFQHHFSAGGGHDLVWGLGYRVSTSALSPGYAVSFAQPSRTDKLYSSFFQDEIRLTDSWWFTIGAKLEHNDYTGVQTEPSARLAWSAPGSRHTLWAAASKAVRQPARADTAVRTDLMTVPIAPGTVQVVRLFGNPEVKNEELRDYEAGYRNEFTKTLSLDVSTFLSFYHHLQTIEPQPMVIVPGVPVQFMVPMLFDNKAHAVTYGGELSMRWNATSRWRISPGYSYLHATIRKDASSTGQAEFGLSSGFPQNMFQLRSAVNLGHKIEFDQAIYYTARLPGGTIPGHARLDLRVARHLGERTEISVVGQSLLRRRTSEYGDSYSIIGTQAVRSVYGQFTWRF